MRDLNECTAQAVSALDAYFQYHPKGMVKREGERIADKYYPRDANGWYDDSIPAKIIEMAHMSYRVLQLEWNITDEMVINDEY